MQKLNKKIDVDWNIKSTIQTIARVLLVMYAAQGVFLTVTTRDGIDWLFTIPLIAFVAFFAYE